MYYRKIFINLLICLLFVTNAVYGGYINSGTSYITTPSYISAPIIMPIENPISGHPSLNQEIPKPQVYTKSVQKFITLKDFDYSAYGKKIICPIYTEEAIAMLDNTFGGNIEEWSGFLASCGAKYIIGHQLTEKNLPELEKNLKKYELNELLAFYAYVTSSYITLLLDKINKDTFNLLYSSSKCSEKHTIKNGLEQYFNNLIISWDRASKNSTDPNESEGMLDDYKIKEIEERIFKFIQHFGYYEFFAYILSDNFTNKHTIDIKLFDKIIKSAQVNIDKHPDKKEIFTDLFTLFKVKLKERKYAPRDKKREVMENFAITCQEDTSKLTVELTKQVQENKQKAEHIQTKLGIAKTQFKQKIDEAEAEKTNLISKYEEQKKDLLVKQKELQSVISILEKQKSAAEYEKKQFQTTATKIQEESNVAFEKELNRLKKEAEKLREIIKESEKKSEQKTIERDMATKQVELLKQQNEAMKKQQIELEQQLERRAKEQLDLKKTNQQLKQQLEQQLRQQLEQQTMKRDMTVKQKAFTQPQPIKKQKTDVSIDSSLEFFDSSDLLQKK